ncbi:MAG: polar amino acid transport system substrate-binding protein [Alteromonadaceae bacterium]|jgi:polar amino acid transport system substrate-binding protein
MLYQFKGDDFLQSLLLNIVIAWSFNFIIITSTQAKNSQIVVEYTLENKNKIIKGRKTENGYQFNASSKNILNLATLEWPPYIGENLCNKGWVFQLTVALLVSKGYQVNIHFFPWARSVKMVEQGEMDILFPEYFIEGSAPSDVIKGKKRSELLVLSNQFPGGNTSFLKRKGEEIDFDGDLASLKGQVIGVVRGYQNMPEFDAMMDAKLFKVISAVDELQLMKLLIGKRVDLIVGDSKVFRYSVNYSTLSNSNKQALLNGVEDVKPELKYNHLYFALSSKSAKWRILLDDINLALLTFKQNGQTQHIIENGSGCVVDF